ncbi:MAG TPA: thiamine pyrophosphate-dependent dehydrogenase E1 component subunit alpha, partial [Thermoanaerobaculia bacterium]
TGVGLSLSMKDTDAIAVVFFGDGAATEGIFHEAMNLAAVWDLPVLFVCENNQWQAYVHRKETMLADHVSDFAKAYRVAARTVDGNDFEAVNDAAKFAVEYVRKNRKPYLLETYTYRTRGHMEPDDQSYVDKNELAAWKAKDPINTLEARLLGNDAITPEELDAIKSRVARRIEDAEAFAIGSPYPSFDELTTDVYA